MKHHVTYVILGRSLCWHPVLLAQSLGLVGGVSLVQVMRQLMIGQDDVRVEVGRGILDPGG